MNRLYKYPRSKAQVAMTEFRCEPQAQEKLQQTIRFRNLQAITTKRQRRAHRRLLKWRENEYSGTRRCDVTCFMMTSLPTFPPKKKAPKCPWRGRRLVTSLQCLLSRPKKRRENGPLRFTAFGQSAGGQTQTLLAVLAARGE